MKVGAKDIRAFLAQPEKAAGTLFYGPDAGLARERAQEVEKRLLGPHPDPFARLELTEEQLRAEPSRLLEALLAISLLGGRQMVLLRAAGDKSAKIIEAAYAEMPDNPNYLVVCADELGPRSALRQLFEAHPRLAAVACYKDEAMDLQSVIRQAFDAARVRCGREAMNYLQQHLGNDRYVTRSELDKIILYVGEDAELTLEQAERLVAHNRDVALDGFCQHLAGGNLAAVDAELAQMFREGTQPAAVLRACLRYFQRLYTVNEAVAAGKPLDQAVAALRPPMFFRAVQPFTQQARLWPLPRIIQALNVLSAAEMEGKQTGANAALLATRACFSIGAMASRAASAAA